MYIQLSSVLLAICLLCSCGRAVISPTTTTIGTTTTSTTTTTTSTTTTTIQDVSIYMPKTIGNKWNYNEAKLSGTVITSSVVTYENIAYVDFPVGTVLGGTKPSKATQLNMTSTEVVTAYYNPITAEVMFYSFDQAYNAYLALKLLQTPFATGETWLAISASSIVGSYIGTAEVLSYGNIDIGGFSYNAYKVRYIYDDERTSGINNRITIDHWYAANIGLVKIAQFNYSDEAFVSASTREVYSYN